MKAVTHILLVLFLALLAVALFIVIIVAFGPIIAGFLHIGETFGTLP
jgi:hypothetical protein